LFLRQFHEPSRIIWFPSAHDMLRVTPNVKGFIRNACARFG
jgi:hypothetical protein